MFPRYNVVMSAGSYRGHAEKTLSAIPARTTVDGNYQKYKIVATFIGIYIRKEHRGGDFC